jgi:enoyl-CoA hydratase/carnithine racemase
LALECVESHALITRVMELAETIAARPTVTARMIKTLFRQFLSSHLHDFLDNCAAIQAICHSTEDHIEAVSSILEKRTPTYSGR